MRIETKACRYCKKRFKSVWRGARPRVTCAAPECLKARRAELHAAYMKLPHVKKKHAEYHKDYLTRPDVIKRRKQYDKERIARLKKEAGIKPPHPRLCSFCLKKYRPVSKWASVHCGKKLCKRKWTHLYERLHKDGRVVIFVESAPVRGLKP